MKWRSVAVAVKVGLLASSIAPARPAPWRAAAHLPAVLSVSPTSLPPAATTNVPAFFYRVRLVP